MGCGQEGWVEMTGTMPGLAALQPIGEASWGSIYRAQGGRVEIVADDGDDGPDAFDQDDDEGDDEDDEEEEDEEPRQRSRRPADRHRRRDEDEEDTEDEDDDPPTREELERINAAIRRNNAENKRYRLLSKQLGRLGYTTDQDLDTWMRDNGLMPASSAPDRQEPDPDPDRQGDKNAPADQNQSKTEAKRHEARGAARVQARYEPALVRVGAKAALADAGWSGKNMAMALRLIDNTQVVVEFDDNGDPVFDGLEQQIDDLKSEFPMWFRPARQVVADPPRRRRVDSRDVDGGNGRRTQRAKPKGWLESLDEQIRG